MAPLSNQRPLIDPLHYSSWQKLTRVTAYVLRFVHNIKSSHLDPRNSRVGPLQPEEISAAETFWIARTQGDLPDWRDLFNGLASFMDGTIIRVGGRLKKSQLDYDQKHPVLLSSSNHISQLIMEDVHRKVSHADPERTLSESHRKVWIVRGRSLAKKLVRDCAVCPKLRQPPHTTLMADLPPERVLPFSPQFSVTGVDLFGPFNLKYGRNKSIKAWGYLFTCATVRAIHLEIVESLSTESFLQAL